MDAYRMLLRNGPSGGSLNDVETRKIIAAGTDPVAMDSYGATLFGLDPQNAEFLVNAQKRGLGESDLSKLNVKTVSLSS